MNKHKQNPRGECRKKKKTKYQNNRSSTAERLFLKLNFRGFKVRTRYDNAHHKTKKDAWPSKPSKGEGEIKVFDSDYGSGDRRELNAIDAENANNQISDALRGYQLRVQKLRY